MNRFFAIMFASVLLCSCTISAAAHKMKEGASHPPEVAERSYAQNYKDLALATCIAQAYSAEPKAAADAGATAAGLDSTWTNYDAEIGAGEITKLVRKYLARKYHSIHGPEIKLDLLKCLDMYHSKELEAQVKHFVIKPDHSYEQDYLGK